MKFHEIDFLVRGETEGGEERGGWEERRVGEDAERWEGELTQSSSR